MRPGGKALSVIGILVGIAGLLTEHGGNLFGPVVAEWAGHAGQLLGVVMAAFGGSIANRPA